MVLRMLKIDKSKLDPIEKSDFPEIVERKGLGHPDTVCDAAAEASSRALCKYYLENFDRYFHHNVDKAALVGGISKPTFGGGLIIEPQYFLLVGRAINQIMIGNELNHIPVGPLCLEATKQVIRDVFRNLDLIKDMHFDHAVRPGSIDLCGLFEESDAMNKIPMANDTSFGVGYAPLSDCEKVTLEAEKLLNSDAFKDKCKASGEDIKVMSHRIGNKIGITLACAMVSKYINDNSEYINYTEQIRDAVLDLAVKIIPDKEVTCQVNVADIIEKDILYLTITGTSAESGDDGEVGRGNRCNGLITPCRTMSLEAVAGKNPINHVGKIYNVLANHVASDIVEAGQGDIIEAHIKLLSQIGRPINDPWVNSVSIISAENVAFSHIEKIVKEVVEKRFSKDAFFELRESFVAGNERIY
jgi:S-adenosylmethionine synthetase